MAMKSLQVECGMQELVEEVIVVGASVIVGASDVLGTSVVLGTTSVLDTAVGIVVSVVVSAACLAT